MISAPLKALLDEIRKHEGKTYGQIYYGAKGVPRDTDVSKMTLNAVLDLQSRMLRAKSASTACGGYQFLRKTLLATMQQMGLNGSELWNEALQDRMAVHLMKNRGLDKFLAGAVSRETFANNLAKEWASLPVVTQIMGQKRIVKPGETYYAGDGLNKAFHKPETILALLDAMRTAAARPAQPVTPPPSPVAPQPQPTPPAPQPVAVKRGFLAWLASLFERA